MVEKSRLSRKLPLLVALAVYVGAAPALALEPKKDEKDKLKACERRICQMIVKKSPDAGTVDCPLTKTWASKTLKDGSKKSAVAWSFGDARCSLDLKVPRALIIEALTAPEVKLQLPLHDVTCEIERENEVTPVHITLGPKVQFKNGKAQHVWINLKKVDGPSHIKTMAFTAAKLEDTVGLFQKPMTKAINKFVADTCPAVVSGKSDKK